MLSESSFFFCAPMKKLRVLFRKESRLDIVRSNHRPREGTLRTRSERGSEHRIAIAMILRESYNDAYIALPYGFGQGFRSSYSGLYLPRYAPGMIRGFVCLERLLKPALYGGRPDFAAICERVLRLAGCLGAGDRQAIELRGILNHSCLSRGYFLLGGDRVFSSSLVISLCVCRMHRREF